jgi:hypothetical protein
MSKPRILVGHAFLKEKRERREGDRQMTSLTTRSVVDRMTADLAIRRQETLHRAAAYLAFARVILNDEPSAMPLPAIAELHPRTAVAA